MIRIVSQTLLKETAGSVENIVEESVRKDAGVSRRTPEMTQIPVRRRGATPSASHPFRVDSFNNTTNSFTSKRNRKRLRKRAESESFTCERNSDSVERWSP
jgi:hypothetical protein